MNTSLKYFLSLLFILGCLNFSFAKKKNSKKIPASGIAWISVEKANELMKTTPKKVYVDIYTDWCGWCKVMDKKTFTNPDVIAYLNKYYYCIHFNAEDTKEVVHKGKTYGADGKNNALAVEWLKGQLSYPTSVFMDEDFENPQPVPGYMEVPQMEMIAKYIAENKHKSIPFETYQKDFKGTWKK
jgi:thioredoxin-related protein